jgi:hypothetical protein
MAKIIEFYVPTNFRKKPPKWLPPEQNGKLIHVVYQEGNRLERQSHFAPVFLCFKPQERPAHFCR